MTFIKSKKIGFIGTGNMGQAIIAALIDSNTVSADHVYVANRSYKKMEKVISSYNVIPVKNNEEIVEKCDVVFLCVKPQDFFEMLQPIKHHFVPTHVVMSLAAGISLKSLEKALPEVANIVRVMPNTPAKIRKGVIGYCVSDKANAVETTVQDLLSPLGIVIQAEEGDEFEALTVSCGSGPGFVFELMMYWQDWLEEHGFSKEHAKRMTIQTFLGASLLAQEAKNHSLEELQDEVVSKKGVTFAGLESVRELDVESLLRISFEKAALRDKELGEKYKF